MVIHQENRPHAFFKQAESNDSNINNKKLVLKARKTTLNLKIEENEQALNYKRNSFLIGSM